MNDLFRCDINILNQVLSNGYRRFFPRGKARPGRDADHSPPSNGAEVENG
jgi:hypothetical protein